MDVIDLTNNDEQDSTILQDLLALYNKSFDREVEQDPILEINIPNLQNQIMMRFLNPVTKAADFVKKLLNLSNMKMTSSEIQEFVDKHCLVVVYMRAIIGLQTNEVHLQKFEPFLATSHLRELFKPLRELSSFFLTHKLSKTHLILLTAISLIHETECNFCTNPAFRKFLSNAWNLWPSHLVSQEKIRDQLRHLRIEINCHDGKIHSLVVNESSIKNVCLFIDNVFDPRR